MDDPDDDIKSACTARVLDIFPELCPDHLAKTAEKLRYDSALVIEEILGAASYPTKSRLKSRKRKRADSGEEDEVSKTRRKHDYEHRPKETALIYISVSKKILAQDFPRVTVKSISALLEENQNHLLRTYLALEEIYRSWRAGKAIVKPGFEMKKTNTAPNIELTPAKLGQTIKDSLFPDRTRALEEARDARRICEAEESKRNAACYKEEVEAKNFEKAQADGTTEDCGCCWDTFALNRMVSCSKSSGEHYFCVECARRNAETAIGLTKYELNCMSMDGCGAGFSNAQRAIFLDDKLIAALDRIECEAVLRAAGFENLETCPFCPFAAEYPPVEENKEFRCTNPDCQVVSCRLCREETHIPKTCEEAARDNGISARRVIEEAMSAALIRKCNKCGTPFIKEEGCNKMTCTRAGCYNVQCYICSTSCDYTHFNDASRGGKQGNCPLFEPVKERHDKEVQEAELRSRKKVLEENPELDENLLKFDVSEMKLEKQKDERHRARQIEHQKEQQRRQQLTRATIAQQRAQARVAQAAAQTAAQTAAQQGKWLEHLAKLQGRALPPAGDPAGQPQAGHLGHPLPFGVQNAHRLPSNHPAVPSPALAGVVALSNERQWPGAQSPFYVSPGYKHRAEPQHPVRSVVQGDQGDQGDQGNVNQVESHWHSPVSLGHRAHQQGAIWPSAGPVYRVQAPIAHANYPAALNPAAQLQRELDEPVLFFDEWNQARQQVQQQAGAGLRHLDRPRPQRAGEAHGPIPPNSDVVNRRTRGPLNGAVWLMNAIRQSREAAKPGRSVDDPLELD